MATMNEIRRLLSQSLPPEQMAGLIADLLAARASSIRGRDQAVQNIDILNAISAALNLEHPIAGLDLGDIGFVLPIALPQIGVNVALRAAATLNGVTGLSQTWIYLEAQRIQANDAITSPAFVAMNGRIPTYDAYTRWDSISIDISAGQPATAIGEVAVAAVTQNTGNIGLMPDFTQAMVRVGTNIARMRFHIQGPIWSYPGRGIYIHLNSPDHDTVTPPTLTVFASGVTAGAGSDLGTGSPQITGYNVESGPT